MNIDKIQCAKIVPKNKDIDNLVIALNEIFPKYEINTINRIAGFLAQCGHESADFTHLEEDLHYSAIRLCQVFPSLFNKENSIAYDMNPEKIGNKIYGSRLGNGSEATGDGYKFRGRGAIQLTGRYNYTVFGGTIELSPDSTIIYLQTLKGAIESACWYWKRNNINSFCDADDITGMTKKINGGSVGLVDRTTRYELAKGILKGILK